MTYPLKLPFTKVCFFSEACYNDIMKIEMPLKEIRAFCQKWDIKEFAIFGSILRDDFSLENSDIDVLILFDEKTTLFDIVDMKTELEILFKRPVDIVSKRSIENSSNKFKREEILNKSEVLYAA